jgi:hypothetical protein
MAAQVDAQGHIIINTASGEDIHDDLGFQLYRVYQVLLSIKSVPIVLQCIPYLQEYQTFGVLIIMLFEMVNDVISFSLVFLISTAAFQVCNGM